MVLKKSLHLNCPEIDPGKRLFCTLLRQVRAWKPQPKLKISVSGAYFSAVETKADYFNRIGQKQSVECRDFEQGRMQCRPYLWGGMLEAERPRNAWCGARCVFFQFLSLPSVVISDTSFHGR